MSELYDIVIIGGGPAGLTAATYARRSGKRVLVVEKNAFGGQITWSPRVENFPGSVSVSGVELGDLLLTQAMEQGADTELDEIISLEKRSDGFFRLTSLYGMEWLAKAVILATGARPRSMGLDREEELTGNGICFCAVCDGAFYKGRPVAVYGGGNSALQDALLLSESCSKVTLIHRRASFRGEARLLEALQAKPNVEFIMNATVTALKGAPALTGITLCVNGNSSDLAVNGLFVAIGHEPDNKAFSALLSLDEKGYAMSDESCATGTPGLFVAGDCRTKSVRQAVTACADGAVAALAACSYIEAI